VRTVVSLARLSGSIPGISGSLLLDLQSSLTFCSLHNLTCFLLKPQLTFSSFASLLLCGLAGPLQGSLLRLGSLVRHTFG
jgi:hypothetical protein